MDSERDNTERQGGGGRSYARQIGSFLPRVARAAFERHGFPSAAVLSEWPLIAGTYMAAFTMPERLIWPRHASHAPREDQTAARQSPHRPSGATLVLRVDGPRALEVQHGAQQILEKVNTYFGYRAVASLRIVQGPVARSRRERKPAPAAGKAPDERGLERISDARLREALARLASQVD